jgi:hypothetical protein
MSEFCTSCGAALNEGAKFCTKCGANASPVSEKSGVQPNQAASKRETVLSKAGKEVKTEAKAKAIEYARSIVSDAIPASQSTGELSLPSELMPAGIPAGDGLLSVLKGGFKSLAGGFKRTLGDKKRLVIVIALAAAWLAVNLLAALDIAPFPLRVISWLTAARGSLIGGSVAKGLVAALLVQLIVDKETLQKLKDGVSKLTAAVKDSKKDVAPLLLGAGAGLCACNLMISSNLQNAMVCIVGFALSAKALTQSGFLRRLTASLFSKASSSAITAVMGGWTLGFALFAAVSLLPGGRNGYLVGVLLLIIGGVLAVIAKNSNKEVSAR